MRRIIFAAVVLFLGAFRAQAQEDYPRTEIFGGYSYMSAEVNPRDLSSGRENLHGWAAGFAGNFTKHLGLATDFAGLYGSASIEGVDRDLDIYVYLFGPRFYLRGERATGFAHFLVGGTTAHAEGFRRDTAFTLDFGGGIDINASDRIAIRVGQFDYKPGRIRGEWFHDFRYSAGIVFKLKGF